MNSAHIGSGGYAESSTTGEYRGKPFDDVTGMKKLTLAQFHLFARSLVVRIAEYAKGRKLEASDLKAVEEIAEAAAKNDFRLNEMIRLIAESQLRTM